MAFKHDKTGQHLRQQMIEGGKQERLRAMQCLSQCYGTGSRAALANMLLASLGQASTIDSVVGYENEYEQGHENASDIKTAGMPRLSTSQVADPLQPSANSPRYSLRDASSAN